MDHDSQFDEEWTSLTSSPFDSSVDDLDIPDQELASIDIPIPLAQDFEGILSTEFPYAESLPAVQPPTSTTLDIDLAMQISRRNSNFSAPESLPFPQPCSAQGPREPLFDIMGLPFDPQVPLSSNIFSPGDRTYLSEPFTSTCMGWPDGSSQPNSFLLFQSELQRQSTDTRMPCLPQMPGSFSVDPKVVPHERSECGTRRPSSAPDTGQTFPSWGIPFQRVSISMPPTKVRPDYVSPSQTVYEAQSATLDVTSRASPPCKMEVDTIHGHANSENTNHDVRVQTKDDHAMTIHPHRGRKQSRSQLPAGASVSSSPDSPGQRKKSVSKIQDAVLVEMRNKGMSYKEIKQAGKFREAVSTLRGRYRNLTTPAQERVRKPKWLPSDVRPPLLVNIFPSSGKNNANSWDRRVHRSICSTMPSADSTKAPDTAATSPSPGPTSRRTWRATEPRTASATSPVARSGASWPVIRRRSGAVPV